MMSTSEKATHNGADSPFLKSSLLSRIESRRADLRTAYPCSLRVIAQALQGCAGDCKCPIYRGVSLPCLAQCCTVLRSRRYQDERQLQSDSRSNGTHSRPSEPQSADTRFQALPYVAESACLSQFLCSRLPAVSRCCALTSVCVSSDPARECSS